MFISACLILLKMLIRSYHGIFQIAVLHFLHCCAPLGFLYPHTSHTNIVFIEEVFKTSSFLFFILLSPLLCFRFRSACRLLRLRNFFGKKNKLYIFVTKDAYENLNFTSEKVAFSVHLPI